LSNSATLKLSTMRNLCVIVVLSGILAGAALGQDKVFDWQKANSEAVQLDPSDYHTGRVYRPGSSGGKIHVDISAREPVTIAMTWIDDWNAAQQHPGQPTELTFRCVHEHVVNTTYVCELPPGRPMVLLVRDERTKDRVLVKSIGAIIGKDATRQFISPNNVSIQYYSWSCVANCAEPEYQWSRLVKEKYKLTNVPKIYNLLTPEYDGQQLYVRVKAPVPMTIAVLPQQFADEVYENPGRLALRLSETSCKQRGVQSLSFNCTFNLADGPQSIIAVPDAAFSGGKKAEIELQTEKCVANCNLLNQ
jgi:hypothetical protein